MQETRIYKEEIDGCKYTVYFTKKDWGWSFEKCEFQGSIGKELTKLREFKDNLWNFIEERTKYINN